MAFKNVHCNCVVCAKPIDHTPNPKPIEHCPHCGATLEWESSYDDNGDVVWTLVRGTLDGKR